MWVVRSVGAVGTVVAVAGSDVAVVAAAVVDGGAGRKVVKNGRHSCAVPYIA